MTSKTDDVREALATALGQRRGHPEPWTSDYYDADAALEAFALISPAPAGVAAVVEEIVDEVKRGASGTTVQALGALSKIEELALSLLTPAAEPAPVGHHSGGEGEQ
ncbi:hypothetical protein [Brevundimonas sp. DS20]|uniref:hypothetical protein n=1 Tax=Brevundimonas sp. DS20 TaxID=1532555 RepID=UPI0006D069F7|nr:hypothetical protein [Brevundimonas sp. DS20]ALJ08272.1 hypothetical protein JL11_07895 [Brevundimonas sp. DS20]